MKTFLQRWWTINRINKLCKIKGGVVWVKEKDFIEYIKSIVVNKNKATDNGVTLAIRWPFNWIGEMNTDLLLWNKVRNIIDECSDEVDGVGYIVRKVDTTGGSEYSLRLSALGRERYSLSYIIFRTDYGKTIWTGVIVAVVVWFVTVRIQQSVSPQMGNHSNHYEHARYGYQQEIIPLQ